MSVFVNDGDVFSIRVRYQPIKNEDGAIVGVNILRLDSEEGEVIVCATKGQDYDTLAAVLEESTIINHISGLPMIRPREFNKLIILRFFRGWNLVGENNQPIPISAATINKMHYRIVRALAREWLRVTRGGA